MKDTVYLDNSATTMVDPEVAQLVVSCMRDGYGNPSSLHRMGMEAEQTVKTASERIAGTLGCTPAEILFTSGGTESDNLAVIGTARALCRRGKHVITTSVEHAAVFEVMKALEKESFEVTYLPVDHNGLVSPHDLEQALREDTILVSVMAVNNEIGTVMPIKELAALTHRISKRAYFHTDAVQAYGKLKLSPGKDGIDLMSVSGHKLHAPKGTGFLYVRKGVRIEPLMYGGGQQAGLRSGTLNVPGIAGLGLACEKAYSSIDSETDRLYRLRDACIPGLLKISPDIRVNGGQTHDTAVSHIVSLTVPGIRSEVLLHALEDKGIYVSAGSACSSHSKHKSATLEAIGLDSDAAGSTIRISTGRYTQETDLEKLTQALAGLVPVLKRYRPV